MPAIVAGVLSVCGAAARRVSVDSREDAADVGGGGNDAVVRDHDAARKSGRGDASGIRLAGAEQRWVADRGQRLGLYGDAVQSDGVAAHDGVKQKEILAVGDQVRRAAL